jgi:hypothetical protein
MLHVERLPALRELRAIVCEGVVCLLQACRARCRSSCGCEARCEHAAVGQSIYLLWVSKGKAEVEQVAASSQSEVWREEEHWRRAAFKCGALSGLFEVTTFQYAALVALASLSEAPGSISQPRPHQPQFHIKYTFQDRCTVAAMLEVSTAYLARLDVSLSARFGAKSWPCAPSPRGETYMCPHGLV